MRTKLLLFLFFVSLLSHAQNILDVKSFQDGVIYEDISYVKYFKQTSDFEINDLNKVVFSPLKDRKSFEGGVYWYTLDVANASSSFVNSIFSVKINGVHEDVLYYESDKGIVAAKPATVEILFIMCFRISSGSIEVTNKSNDHLDALARHLIQAGEVDDDGILHSSKVAWRALANLQIEIEKRQQDAITKTES